jgi:hypothetical protein
MSVGMTLLRRDAGPVPLQPEQPQKKGVRFINLCAVNEPDPLLDPNEPDPLLAMDVINVGVAR